MALRNIREHRIMAFAAASDITRFSQMESELDGQFSSNWAVGSYVDAKDSLERGSLDSLDVVIVCVDQQDENNLEPILEFIKGVKAKEIDTVLVAGHIGPISLHQLMQVGATDFIPYPPPENVFANAINRLKEQAIQSVKDKRAPARKTKGMILPVYGVSGGVGTSTFAINLAWEMVNHTKNSEIKVVVLDFNFQTGSVATYLDLGNRAAVFDMLSDMSELDFETFSQSLTSFRSKLAVMTAPAEIVPLDIVTDDDVTRLLTQAQAAYDFVIVDMPTTLVNWSANVLTMAETYFVMMDLDMRSAQNMMRFLRALKAEELPEEKLQFALNRAPAFTDLSGKQRVKRFSESLGIDINIMLPDGGKAVLAACDRGTPLSIASPKNPLRKEIRKIATSLIEIADEHNMALA